MISYILRKFFQSWTKIGLVNFRFINNDGLIIHNYTAIFFIGNRGDRKIDITPENSQLYNHPYYHDVILPFMHKTGLFTTDEYAIAVINEISSGNIADPKPKKLNRKSPTESVGNVITFPNNKKDE